MQSNLASRAVMAALACLAAGCIPNAGNSPKVDAIVGVWNGDARYCVGMEADGVQPVRSAVAATFHADSTVSFSFSGVFQALPGQDEGAMGSDSHGIWRHLDGNEYEILHTDMIYKKNLEVTGYPASPASRDRNTAVFTINPDGTASWRGESAFHDPFDLDFSGPSEGTCRYDGTFKRLNWPPGEAKAG